jgi:integrase/recombinase XerD
MEEKDLYIELLEKYIRNAKAKGWSERSVKIARSYIRRFMDYLEENQITDITKITKKIISDYSLHLLLYKVRIGNEGKTKPYNATSRMNILVYVKDFFGFLRRENIILFDPSAGVSLPKIPKTLSRDIPTLNEVDRILSCIDKSIKWGLRDYAIIETLYSSGLRSSELVKLKLEDIDFENRFLTVRKGKFDKPRTVPLSNSTILALSEYIEKNRPGFVKNGKDEGFIFLSSRGGGKLITVSINTIVQVYAKKAGIKKHLIPHSFRYACATHMLRNGADIRFVQELLGHESLQVTQGYTRVVKGDLKRMIRLYHPRETDFRGETNG